MSVIKWLDSHCIRIRQIGPPWPIRGTSEGGLRECELQATAQGIWRRPGETFQLEAIEGIQRGLADVDAGRVTPLRQFEQEFRAKRGLPNRFICA